LPEHELWAETVGEGDSMYDCHMKTVAIRVEGN
jgi:hypothetical protein